MAIILVHMLPPVTVLGAAIDTGGFPLYSLTAVCEHGTLVASGMGLVIVCTCMGDCTIADGDVGSASSDLDVVVALLVCCWAFVRVVIMVAVVGAVGAVGAVSACWVSWMWCCCVRRENNDVLFVDA